MSPRAITPYFNYNHQHVLVLDTRDCFTCSFKEFLPFNAAMYYYSSFKAFAKLPVAKATLR
ncbi:MAG: hypothetical protein V4725_15060 [Bacteroidota bacterium]